MDITKGEINEVENKYTLEKVYYASYSFGKTDGEINWFQKDRGTSSQS